MIDPLLGAARGEPPPERQRPSRPEGDPSRPIARDVAPPRDPSRPIAREGMPPRDASGSQPLMIVDDPSLELQSPAPVVAREPVAAPTRSTSPEGEPMPIIVPEPALGNDPDDEWASIDALLDRGPTVLPVIVPAQPHTAPPANEPAAPVPPVVPTPPQPAMPTAPAPAPIPMPVLPVLAPTAAVPVLPVLADTPAGGPLPGREVRAPRPVTTAPQRRPRVRRVTRVVRHVDTWSVFKVALVFNLFLYVVALTAGVLLWQVAQNTGTVDNVERFFESFGWQTFTLHGGEIYHNAWVAGLFGVIGLTGLAVLMATLFNLITDLVGGIRVSVLEEEVVAREDRGVGWRAALRLPERFIDRAQPG
ncbi:MAG: DUF3566 domain-containing protein [Actinomycetota bacterium]|nr:DUF3566 domain-containing protein [Actinomycetota bacterium]